MSEADRPIAEEELHAYVDGLIDGDRRAEVERYLRAHADVAARVAAYQEQRQALRALFASAASTPIPPRLNISRLLEEHLRRRSVPRRAIAASVAAALIVGGAGGWLLGTRAPAGLDAIAREGASSYRVFAADKRRPVEVWAPERDDLTRWLSNRLNRPVAAPDLSSAGYKLLGGRLVANPQGRPAALFVYENATGGRLTIYARPMAASESSSIERTDIADVDGCAWIERGIGYALVAPEPYDKLLDLSRQARKELSTAS